MYLAIHSRMQLMVDFDQWIGSIVCIAGKTERWPVARWNQSVGVALPENLAPRLTTPLTVWTCGSAAVVPVCLTIPIASIAKSTPHPAVGHPLPSLREGRGQVEGCFGGPRSVVGPKKRESELRGKAAPSPPSARRNFNGESPDPVLESVVLIHEVQQGECLSTIAHSYGFVDWRTIYDHSSNAQFRSLRPNPNLIYPGDLINIPQLESREETRASDSTHRFRARTPRLEIWIRVVDWLAAPLANRRYELEIGVAHHEGMTDNDGFLKHTIVPGAHEGQLTVFLDASAEEILGGGARLIWHLEIGALDPLETHSGVQARLNNLGFSCGPVDGIVGPMTRSATKAFQYQYNLQVDGIAGPQTWRKLREIHGC
jgi:N-acetylmuramoyl-L-alanine amidase